eukprot:CAMPEP_0194053742 /NCGR_PEP_ID=MMETSP0009_2-20130614/51050_1 /TAXON_ID=210454 /ORGANISM="Grammatophora oceanica, Strain CCMP 410" /LENGTH=69 /DNA_ID=CAMNT_0038701979 /DNA_START=45 /DNA_END=251 /DNA_ORIENTATION=-
METDRQTLLGLTELIVVVLLRIFKLTCDVILRVGELVLNEKFILEEPTKDSQPQVDQRFRLKLPEDDDV